MYSFFGQFASSSLYVLFMSAKVRKFCYIMYIATICFLAYPLHFRLQR